MQSLRNNVLVDVTPNLEQAITEQPTAYDLDKVVEQLEENIKHTEREAKEYGEKGNIGVFAMLDARAKAYRNSIKIVKSGGIE